MKDKRVSTELKVGILVLAAILVLFYMSFRIGKFGAFHEPGYDLYVTLQNAGGIDPRTPIQIAGVEVGRVRNIKLEGYKALVTLNVRKGVQVPVDSKVTVKNQGILGDKFIEIIPGEAKQFLARGERINDVVMPPDLNEVFAEVGVAAKNFGETIGEFKGLIGEEEKKNIKKSLANIESASGDFKKLVSDNKKGITRFVSNMDKISSDIEKGKGTIGKLVKDDSLYNDAKDTVASLKTISKDIEQGKGTLGKLAKDDALYDEAKVAVANIKEITDGIKKGEGTLGKLAKDDSLYNETEKAMKKVQKGAEGLQEMTPVTVLGTIFSVFF